MKGNLVLTYQRFGANERPYTVHVWGRGSNAGYCEVVWYLSRRWPTEPTLDDLQRIVASVVEYDVTLRDMGDNVYWFRRKT